MKKLFIIIAVAAMVVTFAQMTFALDVKFYVDSAPNTYGSPSWAPWWSQTKADVVAGTFTDMRTGTYPGTHVMDPYDEIVYSTGDLGKRLHWIYWVPNSTIDALKTVNFEVKWVIDWGGDAWTYEGGDWAADGPNVGWSQPARSEEYNGGVIGSLGFAWWATDNEALPHSTDGNLYNETNQADIDALRSEIFKYQTYAIGMYRYDEAGETTSGSLKVTMVPEPGTLMLLGFGLIGVAVARRKA